jgi:hypothetical protein
VAAVLTTVVPAGVLVPVVTVRDAPRGSFDVGYTFEAMGRKIDARVVQDALNCGNSFIMTGGVTYLLDSEAINSMREVFSDCATSQWADSRRSTHFLMTLQPWRTAEEHSALCADSMAAARASCFR